MRSRQKALLAADLARDKRAEEIVMLDMRKISSITDFFVIATASSTKRAQTVSENIEEGLVVSGQILSCIEGYQEGRWVLIDAYDVVVHIFTREARGFYNLEGLWGHAPKVRLCQKKKKCSSERASKRK